MAGSAVLAVDGFAVLNELRRDFRFWRDGQVREADAGCLDGRCSRLVFGLGSACGVPWPTARSGEQQRDEKRRNVSSFHVHTKKVSRVRISFFDSSQRIQKFFGSWPE